MDAARPHPKAGHHLIKNQNGTRLGALAAQGFQKTWRGSNQVHVAGDWLHDDGCNVLAMLGKAGLHTGDVVVVQHNGLGGETGRHPGRSGVTEGQQTRAGFDQQAVHVTVVAAFEFDDLVASGVTTGQAYGRHGGLCAAGGQAHHLHAGQVITNPLGQLHLATGWRTERQAPFGGLLNRLNHLGVGMPNNRRTPRADGVDITVAVCVPEIGAIGLGKKARRPADRAEGSNR